MTVLTALSPLALGPQSSQDTLTQAINDLMGALNGQEATAVAIKGQFRYPYGTPNISRVLTVNTETGTVTTNGTTTLTGASTLFLSVLKVGDSIWVDGETVRTVATIASNTSLTVTLAFSTSVGSLSYSVGNTAWAAAGTPGAHASTHSSGQTDPISLQNLAGAVTDAQVPNTITLDNITQITTRLHSSLGALTADDHSQYALLAGRATGQILIGDTASGGNLTLQSTSHATRGKILFGANSAYDEANTRLGIGANTPAVELDVIGAGAVATGVSRYHALLLDSTAMAQDVGLAVVLGGKYQSAGLGGGTAGFAAIKGHKENATDGNTAGALVFYTRPAAGNLTEVLRLPSTGGMTLVGNITLSTAGATVDGVDVGAHPGLPDVHHARLHSMTGSTDHGSSTLGDTVYGGAGGTWVALSGQLTSTRAFLRSVGDGAGGPTVPAWDTLADGDIPATIARLASPVFNGTVTIPTPFTLGAVSVTATGTQLNYLNAATGTTGTASTNLVFSTSPTLAGNINFPGSGIWNSSGWIGVGTVIPGAMLHVKNGRIRIEDATSPELDFFIGATDYGEIYANTGGLNLSATQASTGVSLYWRDGASAQQPGIILSGTGTVTIGALAGAVIATAGVLSAGTLAATLGGTGFASYAVGDLLYANTATTLAKLADIATGNALISGGVGVALSWGKIGLDTHLSAATLPYANLPTGGGTWANGAGNLTITGQRILASYAAVEGAQNGATTTGFYKTSTAAGVLGFTGLLGRGLTLVVAASDATDGEKAGADYICNGAADEAEIQLAIDALYDASYGGTVQLTSGKFIISATILLRDDGGVAGVMRKAVRLVGAGRGAAGSVGASGTGNVGEGATILEAQSAGLTVIQMGDNSDVHYGCAVECLTISLLSSITTITGIGIYFPATSTRYGRVHNVQICNMFNGIKHSGGSGTEISHCRIDDTGMRPDKVGTASATADAILIEAGDVRIFETLCYNDWAVAGTSHRARSAIHITGCGAVEINQCDMPNFLGSVLIDPSTLAGTTKSMTASKTGTTVTRTAGDTFASGDAGRLLHWGTATLFDVVVTYTDANTVEVKDSATIASQTATVGDTTVTNVFIKDSDLDIATNQNLRIAPSSTGAVHTVTVQDCWLASTTGASGWGAAIEGGATGSTRNVLFVGCLFKNHAAGGITIGKVKDIQIVGCHILGRAGSVSTGSGIRILGTSGGPADNISVRDTFIGGGHYRFGFATGLEVTAGATNVTYSGLTFGDNTADLSDAAASHGAHYYSSPLYLQPVDATNEGGELHFVGAGSNTHYYIDNSSGALRFITKASYPAGAESVRVTFGGSGNVGVGMTPVTDIFEVAGNIRLAVSSAVNRGFTIERTGTGAAIWTIHSPSNSSDLRFYRGSDLVTITSTGHVGVKTATPDVEGLGANYPVLNMRAIVDRYPSILYLAGQTDTIGDAGGDLIWGIYRTTGGTWNRLARLEGTTSGALNTGQVNLWLNTAGVESVRYKFQADGTALADVAWNTFSPQPPKPETQMLPDDYLDWALEHARKPVKPYSGIPDDPAEVKKYAKDLARISIGTARYVEHLRGVVAVQAQDIVSLRVEVEQLKARLN